MYHASKTSTNKRFTDGFNILVSYAFGKIWEMPGGNVRSYIKNAHNLSSEGGPAAPDIRQWLSVNNLYELSVGREREVKRNKWDWGGNPVWLPDCGDYQLWVDHKYGNG